MMKVIIYKLDCDEDPITTLSVGEHVFGRGELLKCDDRRVSRAHGVIKITPQAATITSLHQNPCFYQAAKSLTITILPKDNPTNIHDGDKFALLADSYWFRIKLQENDCDDTTISTATINSPESTSNKDPHTTIKRECEDEASSELSNSKRLKIDEDNDTNKDVKVNGVKKENLSESDDEIDKGSKSNTIKTEKESELSGEVASTNSELLSTDENEVTTTSTSTIKNTQEFNQNSNVASTSGTQDKKKNRERCWYGLGCYRKNVTHFAEFSHPGDSDYASDPDDDRPTCEYGASCYRRNKEHRQNYKHPPKDNTSPAPQDQGKIKGRTKRKTTKTNYESDSSENDYDLEDPFIADSGSEYEADSGSDDDSDSDWSGSDEEMKRLIKEAKRFIRTQKKT